MSRWRRLASKAVAASSLGLFTLLLGATTGCEFIAKVDRAEIPDGAGGAAGAGGNSGGCTTADSCPGTDTVCRIRTCVSGMCGFENLPEGPAPSDAQTTGDCRQVVCGPMGEVSTINDDTDRLDDQNDCTDDICDSGTPSNVDRMAGAACGPNQDQLCDGMGTCVECVQASDCASLVCESNQCVPASCLDTVTNGVETDVDCGGADCTPCADLLTCAVNEDCMSKICSETVCQVPTCTDTVQNGNESDVDCGTACLPTLCAPGKGCNVDADCVGGSCSGSVCLETCTDMLLNNNETDVDCGGPNCNPCVDGQICSVGSDCVSKSCDNGTCVAPTCTDQIQNGSETGIDCGNTMVSNCPVCADGQGCSVGSDCTSGVCSGMVCQVPTCSDMTANGNETDVDCGGPDCTTKCAVGLKCTTNPDCASNICNNLICVASLCGDNILTMGFETCEDGNTTAGDGCGPNCAPEAGFTCSNDTNNTPPSSCTPICQDGLVVAGEACDDGNGSAGDGCAANCTVELGYGCMGQPSACSTVCGDGVLTPNEACDDGNVFGGDGCLDTCIVQPGFTCTNTPLALSTCAAICGDGLRVGFEECDDGDTSSGDGCSSSCVVEPSYGCAGEPSVCSPIETEANNTCVEANGPFLPPFVLSGKIQPAGDHDYIKITVPAHADLKLETFGPVLGQCVSSDTYLELRSTNCSTILVGDDDDSVLGTCSLIDPAVAADAAARNLAPGIYYVNVRHFSTTGTIANYKLQVTFSALCGNGVVEGSETCDDGNVTPGDGCATNCRIEPNFEAETNDSCAQANGPLPAPVLFGGGITPAADVDYYAFTLSSYSDVKIQTFAPQYGVCTTTDTAIQLVGSDCSTVLTTNNDGGIGTCSLIDSTTNAAAARLAPGTYYVRVEENGNNATIGTYEVLVSLNAKCGDGLKQGSETCDDGNTNSGDGCGNDCRLEQGWTCTGAPTTCVFNCGNQGAMTTITGTEQCDDSNQMSGDGCSDVCMIEPGYICVGTPSVCTVSCGNSLIDGADQCDDGNQISGDGCNNVCQLELDYRCVTPGTPCTMYEGLCNDSIDNDGDTLMDAADPDCQIPAYFPACTGMQKLRVVQSIDIPKAIPDSNTTGVTSVVQVGVGAGTIARAAVTFNITHTYDGDLDLSLITPANMTLDASSDNGGGNNDYLSTVLDSTCPTAVTSGAAPFSGCYAPEAAFSGLVGTSASGTWKFKAVDDAGGDLGNLTAWAMIFCIQP